MKILKKKILFLFLFFNLFGYSQDIIEKEYQSEIVFLKNQDIKNILFEIIGKFNSCETKGVNWYIDFTKRDLIILTKGRIVNLLAINKENDIYTTVINIEIVFVLTEKDNNELFNKSEFSVDLSFYIDKSVIIIEDYSYWIIKRDNNLLRVIKEHLFRCK